MATANWWERSPHASNNNNFRYVNNNGNSNNNNSNNSYLLAPDFTETCVAYSKGDLKQNACERRRATRGQPKTPKPLP